ncbi:MAG: hypothetical protein LBH43_05910 [Treponema sp.]|nr:hypothetical protein [Treponema sp.]
MLAGTHNVSISNPDGTIIPLSFIDSAAVRLEGDLRFIRGIQLDLTAPQNYLTHKGSLAAVFYSELNRIPLPGAADVDAVQLCIEALPEKILNTWQIPLRPNHGLRNSPYVKIPVNIVQPSSFPMLFRLMPVFKGFSEEMEKMVFHLHVRPILGDEGAVKINFQYPDKLPGRSIVALVDDKVIENPQEEWLIKEGEHYLVILSEHYRNFNRRFVVERAKTLDLFIELQDPTPLLIFEYPENARIFVNNTQVANPDNPFPVEAGVHEVRFQISDYSIIRPVLVQRGKTYRIALSVDVDITEND